MRDRKEQLREFNETLSLVTNILKNGENDSKTKELKEKVEDTLCKLLEESFYVRKEELNAMFVKEYIYIAHVVGVDFLEQPVDLSILVYEVYGYAKEALIYDIGNKKKIHAVEEYF